MKINHQSTMTKTLYW